MTSLAPTNQVHESFALDGEAMPLRSAAEAPRGMREEMKQEILAHEIARYAPGLALLLRRQGLARLRAELREA